MLVFKLRSEHFARNAPISGCFTSTSRSEQDPKVILRVSWNIEFPNPSLSHRLFNLNKKQCGRPTGNLLKEADQEVHTTR